MYMALFVNNQGQRSELQERLVAELREKAERNGAQVEEKEYDAVEDSRYAKDYKQTTSLAWVWALIGLAIAGIIIATIIIVS